MAAAAAGSAEVVEVEVVEEVAEVRHLAEAEADSAESYMCRNRPTHRCESTLR